MSKRPTSLVEWLDRYEEKRLRAFYNYQDSGEAKYDRQVEEFEIICDGLTALMRERDKARDDIDKRSKNCDWMCGQLLKNEYSRSEVVKMLHDAVYW